MCIKKIFAVLAATIITGTFVLSLGEAASGPPRWVSQTDTRAVRTQGAEPSANLTLLAALSTAGLRPLGD